MKRMIPLALAAAVMALAMGCSKEKKDPGYYKIPKQPQKEIDTTLHAMEGHDFETSIPWNDSQYRIIIARAPIDSMPEIHTGDGVRYKDNRIRIKILRHDSSVFFNHAFTKRSFSDILTPHFKKEGALLNLVFEQDLTDKDHLYFAGSVGDPDELSDEMIPLQLVIDRYGIFTYKVDDIDTHNAHADTTFIDDSYKKEEEDRLRNKNGL